MLERGFLFQKFIIIISEVKSSRDKYTHFESTNSHCSTKVLKLVKVIVNKIICLNLIILFSQGGGAFIREGCLLQISVG